MAKLTIIRSSQYVNSMRSINIMIDGKSIGRVANGETRTFDIPTGLHKVKAKIDWCGSREQTIDVHENDEAVLNLSAFKGSKLIGSKYSMATTVLFILAMIFLTGPVKQYLIAGYLAFCCIMLLPMIYIFTIGRNRYLLLERRLDVL